MQNLQFSIGESKRQCNPISHPLSSMNGLVLQILKKSFALWMCVRNFQSCHSNRMIKNQQINLDESRGRISMVLNNRQSTHGFKGPPLYESSYCAWAVTLLWIPKRLQISLQESDFIVPKMIFGWNCCQSMRGEGAWIFSTQYFIYPLCCDASL